MRSLKVASVIAASCVLAAVAAPKVVTAGELVRAYVLIEAKPGQMEAALQSLNGLGNCLALTHSFMSNEIVAHLHCDGADYLNTAIANNIARSDAVERATVLTVLKEP
jgi:hypothetical protein